MLKKWFTRDLNATFTFAVVHEGQNQPIHCWKSISRLHQLLCYVLFLAADYYKTWTARDPIKRCLPQAPMKNDQRNCVLVWWLFVLSKTPSHSLLMKKRNNKNLATEFPSLGPCISSVLERDFHEVCCINATILKRPHSPCNSVEWKSLICPIGDVEISLHTPSIKTVIQKWEKF